MRDALPDTLLDYTEIDIDDPPRDTSRPKTPLPGATRALRRTISYASIETVLPPKSKGVRRHIVGMAGNLRHRSGRKRNQSPSPQDDPKIALGDLPPDTKATPTGKKSGRRRKATATLQDPPGTATDRLHSGVPLEQDVPSIFLGCDSDSLIEPLVKAAEKNVEDIVRTLDILHPSRVARADIKDIQLDIQPSESDLTIWDGLQVDHHMFQCRVFLRCTTHPYDSVTLPDIHCFEMDCHTHPPGSHRHVKPPILQTRYNGTAVSWVNDKPKVDLAAGIHMDRYWRTILDPDGTWGWFRDVFVPLSTRLFDKMEYREFKLVSRLWVGQVSIEKELTFGISMLLREVDMK